MPFGACALARRAAIGLAAIASIAAGPAFATPYLVVDADSDQVLFQNEATAVWYPASLTKLMTLYVALDAVRAGRLTLDTPLVVSPRAARMPPSKMGFRPGTQVTLDNALKMLMVQSPNDVAVMIAEGISGSVEAFADSMNEAAQRLGMHESHFVNPNGLHNPDHVSSARDMAILARALLREFPEHADLFDIGAIQLGNRILHNHNGLLGRYPGADGMKTGFTCPAGWNLVASANHDGRRLITVVLGAPSARLRNQEAADLFDRGFATGGGSGTLESLPPPSSSQAPNMRVDVCLHRSAAVMAAAEEEAAGSVPTAPTGRGGVLLASAPAPAHTLLPSQRPHFDPVKVFVGPVQGWKGPVLAARPSAGSLPADAKAYSGENPGAVEDKPSTGAASAPEALKSAVVTPPLTARRGKAMRAKALAPKGRAKSSLHAAAAHKVDKSAKAGEAGPSKRGTAVTQANK